MGKDKLTELADLMKQLEVELQELRAQRQQLAAQRKRTHRTWEEQEKREILAQSEQARESGAPIIDVLSKYKITSTHEINWRKQLNGHKE